MSHQRTSLGAGWRGRAIANLIAFFVLGVEGEAAAAGYRETFEGGGTPVSALHGMLQPGQDGVWSVRLEAGACVLDNRREPAAVKYYYVLPGANTWRNAGDVIRVEVGGEFPGGQYRSGAGLLFGFEPGTRHYYAFVLEENGGHAFYRRDAGGFQRVLSGRSGASKPAARTTLEVHRTGGTITLMVNGTRIGLLSGQGPHGDGVGLIAIGVGRFEFDNFELPQAVLAEAGGAPAQGTTLQAILPQLAGAGQPGGSPAGYRAVRHSGASGDLLVKKSSGMGPATSAIRSAVADFGRYFEGAPQLHSAVGDRENAEVQVLFSARLRGAPVQGVAMAVASGGATTTAVAYDEASRFPGSFAAMMDALKPEFPSPPPAAAGAQALQQRPLSDGSGSIGLPADWRIAAAKKGTVEAFGPDGSKVALGVHGPVYTPQAAAQLQQNMNAMGMSVAGRGLLVIPYADPVTAFAQFIEMSPVAYSQSLGRQLLPQKVTRIVEHAARPWPNGQAALIDAEWTEGSVPYRSVALFGMQPGGGGTWTHYLSMVSAPAARFASNMPTLTAIWESWKIAGSVHQERIGQALANLREVSRIIDQVDARRQASNDASHANWLRYVRGTTPVRDPITGDVREVPSINADQVVDALNQAAGYNRYQEVPVRDLQ